MTEDQSKAMIEILEGCIDTLKEGKEIVTNGRMECKSKLVPHCECGSRVLSYTCHGSYVTISYETSIKPCTPEVKEEEHMYRGTFE